MLIIEKGERRRGIWKFSIRKSQFEIVEEYPGGDIRGRKGEVGAREQVMGMVYVEKPVEVDEISKREMVLEGRG